MRILLITPNVPWPTHTGGNQRTNLLHRALSEHGEVDTVVMIRYGVLPKEQREATAERFGGKLFFDNCLPEHRTPWRLAGRYAARLAHAVGGWGLDYAPDPVVAARVARLIKERDYDLIVGRYLWPLARSGAVGLRPTLIDVDDFESDVLEAELTARQRPSLKQWWHGRRYRQVLRRERAVLAECSSVWVAKQADLARLSRDDVSVLPNIPFVKPGAEAPEPCAPRPASRAIMMVGTLEHTVNVRAIDAFIDRVWPKVLAEVPDATFQIVGSGMSDDMRQRWGALPGVVPVGYAEDLREAYAGCAFTVVPINEGGGTKIKVLESLLLGRTCVVSPHSLRGYEDALMDGESLRVGEGDQGFAANCIELLRDPGLRARLADNGRGVVGEGFTYPRFASTVADAVAGLMGAGDQANHHKG
ncbi:MAG: glycosyltransferase family 4 protein [Phycisphaeraceae bacterium]|nr:glycosyltransferase family 4 protein [Phycisphaeraceae bacterium]